MYCDFFGLRCRPFEDRADTEFYFTTPEHEEALASIEYEARYGQGMALLLGEPGTGKTLLVRMLLRKLADKASLLEASDRVVVLTWPASGQGDLMRETCKGFGISLPASHQLAKPACWSAKPACETSRLSTRLKRHLKRSRQAGHRSILVIDQAENLTAQNLAELETIMDCQSQLAGCQSQLAGSQQGGESLLSIILTAAPRFRETLAKKELARLQQKLFGERTLLPLTLEQTGVYVIHRLRICGAGERQPFSPDAIGPIYEASKGIPRLINRLCNAAMLAAYGAGKSTIGRDVAVEVASTECGIERSVDASRLGLTSTRQADQQAGYAGCTGPPAAPGWRSDGPGDFLVPPSSTSPAPQQAVADEWGDPHIDIGSAARDPGDGSELTSLAAQDIDLASNPGSISSVTLPGAGDADVLVDRLHRATARAERSGATTEASIAQHRAIEKHLTTLNADAERLAGRLTETVRAAASSLTAMEERFATLDTAAEDQTQGMEEQVSQASRVAADLQGKIAGLNEACRDGERVQTQLTQFADELADKGHGVQDRVTQLMASVASGDAVEQRLEDLLGQVQQRIDTLARDAAARSTSAEERINEVVDRASARISDSRQQVGGLVRKASQCAAELEETLKGSCAGLDTLKQDADRFEEQFLRKSLERAQVQLEEQIAKHLDGQLQKRKEAIEAVLRRAAGVAADADRAVSAIDEKLNGKRTEIEKFVEDFTSEAFDRFRAKLQTHFDSQLEAMEERVAASRREMETKLATYEDATSTLHASGASMMKELQRQMEDLESRRDDVASSLASLSTGVAKTLVEASGLGTTVQSVSSSVEQLATRAQAAESGLSQSVTDAERLVGETHSVRGQLETLQHSAANTLVNVGRACEQMTSLQQQTHATEALIDQMASSHRECEDVAERLGEQRTDARELIERSVELVSRGTEQTDQLGSHIESAEALVGELTRTNAVARSTNEEIGHSIQRAETVTEEAGQQRSRLDATLKAAETSGTQLDDMVVAATQLHDAMQGLVSHADDKVTRLDSHQAAATQVLNKISETTVTGHELLDRLIDWQSRLAGAKRGSEEIVDRIDRMTTDAWDLAGQAQTRSTELAEMGEKVERMVTDFERRVEPASALISRLEEGVNTAQTHADRFDERCKEATGLAERLNGIGEIVQAAKVVDSDLRTSHDEARLSLEQLQHACAGAAGHLAAIAEIKGGVVELGQRYDQTKEEAQWITQRLSVQVTAAEESFNRCEPQLNEFLEQMRSAWEFLRDLEVRGKQVEERLAASIEGPVEIVEAAQSQAAELNRVCDAVRKIFSGLSKASLEARQQINDCRATNETASRQIVQLTTQTDRAANTLHEWVQEAARVQARLEGTIQKTPSIQETHPGGALRDMSRLTTAIPRITAPPPASSVATMPGPPANKATVHAPTRDRARNRVEDVAGLIQDAKQTAEATT